MFLLFKSKLKLYWNIRQVVPEFKYEKKFTKIIFFITKLFSKYPKAIIFNSIESMKDHIRINYSNSNNIFIPNGFEYNKMLNEFIDPNFEKKIKNKKIISLIARYHLSKGHLFFIETAINILKKNSNLIFLIAGKNVMKQKEIFEIIEKSNFEIICIYDHLDNVNYYLNKTDILVNCSYSSEGFPNILGEGIINNCLCITSGIGDAKEYSITIIFLYLKMKRKF